MGYETRYSIQVKNANPDEKRALYGELQGFGPNFQYQVDAKWYEWQEDMSTLSKNYPHVEFILDGVGEESGDVWRAFIFNGAVKIYRQPAWIPPEKPTEPW